MTDEQWSRRGFLGALGVAAVGGAAGCTAPAGNQAAPPNSGSVYTRVYRDIIDSVVLVQVFTADGPTQGSGFAFGGRGLVVTNQHVVEGANGIEVRFRDGEWRTGEVVGTDVYSDLAVVRAGDPPGYAGPLSLSETPPVIGQEVVAVGSPFGLEESLSAGVISGVHRSLPTAGGFTIADAVQTDAAVNPGNSGGPLVTLDGGVVGVIRSGGGENIGFAISAALVERVVPRLVEDGAYDHPYMGVSLLDVTPTVAEANDLDVTRGVLVVDVLDGGPSSGALRGSDDEERINGVRVPVGGDVVLRLDDRRVTTMGDLSRYLALETRPGDAIELTVTRDGSRVRVPLTLGTRPPP